MIREKIWFPDIDKLVKTTIDRCIPCQATSKPNPPEPLSMTEMPNGPWELLHVDFKGPLPSGEYLLVVTDRYSRFPEVEIVNSTRASTVIPKLDKIFAVHGIPLQVKSDNGPPFNSEEYDRYFKILGIKKVLSTPVWPQANAEVERFMQPLTKSLQTARIENRPWKQELQRFLLQYRTTPHCSTGVPPVELLYNRSVRGKLPLLDKKKILNRHAEAKHNEIAKQTYNKNYADKRRNTKESNIAVGDCVLVRQPGTNKLTPNFSETPYTVIKRERSRITAENKEGHRITRNISHFKKLPKEHCQLNNDDDDDDYNDRNEIIVAERDQEQSVRRSTRESKQPERYGQPIPF